MEHLDIGHRGTASSNFEGVLTHDGAGSSERCDPHAWYMTIPRTFKSMITGSYMHRKVLTILRRLAILRSLRDTRHLPPSPPVSSSCRRSRETHLSTAATKKWEILYNHSGLIVSRRLSGPCNGIAPFAVALILTSEVPSR